MQNMPAAFGDIIFQEVILLNNTQIPLSRLPVGEKANVSRLLSDGMTRRRMLDLGLVDGAEITPLYKSPSGNPVAYLIRGAVIALRADVSGDIIVSSE